MAAPPVANHFNKTRPSQLLGTAMKTFICCKSTRIGLSQWIEFSSDGPISAIRWLVNGPIRSKSCAINSRDSRLGDVNNNQQAKTEIIHPILGRKQEDSFRAVDKTMGGVNAIWRPELGAGVFCCASLLFCYWKRMRGEKWTRSCPPSNGVNDDVKTYNWCPLVARYMAIVCNDCCHWSPWATICGRSDCVFQDADTFVLK